MPFLPGTKVSLWSDTAANSGMPLRTVPWIAGTLEWQDAVSGASSSSRGYARFQVPIDDPAVQAAGILDVVRIDDPQPDGAGGFTIATWEYRITQLDDTKGPTVTVTASPILEDAGRVQMRSVIGGVPTKTVAFKPLAPAEILSLVILPAMTAAGMLGISIGTVTPVGRYSFSQRDQTMLGLIAWLEQTTQSECWLERVSESAWTLNLGTRNASAANPVIHTGRNVTALLDRTILVDGSFANRVEPEGQVATGETEPTHLGQAQWNASGVSGVGSRVVTLADPDMPGDVIAFDEQLTGKEALVPNLPLCSAAAPAAVALTFDTTRRLLWWLESGSETLRWRDVESDATGSLNLAQGGTAAFMAYDSSVDRLVIAYSNLATVLLVNPATPAVTNVITTTSAPLSLSVIPALSRAYVQMTGAFPQVINTSTAAIAVWTSGPGGTRLFYHAASNRIVSWNPGSSGFGVWAAPAGAVVNSSVATGGVAFWMADDPSQTTMGVVQSGALNWGTATISGTPSFSGFTAMPAAPSGVTLGPTDLLSAGGRYYVLGGTGSARYVVGWTGSAYTGTTGQNVGDVGSVAAGAYALERGPTTAETANLWVADNVAGIRRLALTTDCSAFEHWTVQATDATNQTVTMPASGSGGPVRIPTAAGFQARVSFRENENLDYLTRLEDPASVDIYRAIDTSPDVSAVLAKANWWRGGTFDEWRADDTHRWLSESGSGAGSNAIRFRANEASPIANLALTFNGAYTALATTVAVSGLGAGRTVQPGDVLVFNAQAAFVTQHATADGSGNATLSFTGFASSASSGAAVGYTQPDLGSLPNSRTDCPVLYSTNSRAFGGLAAVPHITGDSVVWVTAHVKIACYGGTPNTNKLTVRDPYATSDHPAVVPAQTGDTSAQGLVVGTTATPVIIERWLGQRVDLSTTPGHGVVRFVLTPGASCVMYVISMSVILAADSLADATNQTGVTDLYDSEGPRAVWRIGQGRLLAGSNPSVQYRVQAIEDGHPFLIGATAILRDPSRGIAARPRIVAVTRQGRRPNEPMVQPELELSTVPTSLLRSLLDLQTATQNLLQGAA